MHQGLGLIALETQGIIRVSLEASGLPTCPLQTIQILQVAEELRSTEVGMTVGKGEFKARLRNKVKTGYEETKLAALSLPNTSARDDVVDHRRERREVKWHVVRQHAAGRNRHSPRTPIHNQIGFADGHVVRVLDAAIRAMESVFKNPRHVVTMNHSPDQRLFSRQISGCARHGQAVTAVTRRSASCNNASSNFDRAQSADVNARSELTMCAHYKLTKGMLLETPFLAI